MKRYRLSFWCVVVLLCLSILSSLPRDRYSHVTTGMDMLAGTGITEGESRVIEEGSGTSAGLFTATAPVPLQKGAYRVIFRYTTMAAGNTAVLYSESSVNPDNSLGVVYETAALGYPVYGEETFSLKLRQDVPDFQVQGYYGGDNAFMVHSVSIMSEGLLYTDTLLIALAILLFAFWFDRALLRRPLALGEAMQDRFSRYAPVFLVAGLGLLVSYPIFNDTLSVGHDIYFHPTRLEGISAAFLDGQFPPRINPDALNYKGYATSLMYPDLLMWPFALLRLLGLSYIGAYKLLCLLANFASAALAYLAGRRIFGSRFAGAATSVLYTFAQYRLYNLYLRDALGEAIAMAVFPVVLWGLYEVYFGDEAKWPVLVLGVTLVFQSHIITSFVMAMFCGLFFVVFLPHLIRNKARALPLAKAVGLAGLLNLWFLAPLLYMMRENLHVTVIQSGFYNQLSTVTELLFDVRYSFNSPGAVMFMAGAVLLAGLMFLHKTDDTALARRVGGAALSFGTLFTFLGCTLSPWYILNFVPIVSANIARIQFPQRFFAVVCAFFALCGGAAVLLFGFKKRQVKLAVVLVLTTACFFAATGLMNSSLAANKEEPFAKRLEPPVWHTWKDAHIGFWEYLYNGYDLSVLMRPNQLVSDGALAVTDYARNGTRVSFSYTAGGASYLDIPLLYYPGYSVTDENGNKLAYTISPETFIRLENPAQSGSIQTRYTGVWWWRVTDCVSLATVLACAVWFTVKKLKSRPAT